MLMRKIALLLLSAMLLGLVGCGTTSMGYNPLEEHTDGGSDSGTLPLQVR